MKTQNLKAVSIRVPSDLWQMFIDECQANDTNASREIRRMIRQYMKDKRQMKLV